MVVLWLMSAFAGKPTMIPSVAPDWAQPGAQLHYSVQSGSDAYDFDVTVEQVAPDLVFSWSMSTGIKGKRTIKAADVAAARGQNNFFGDGEEWTEAGSSSVFLSKAQMDEIAKTGKTSAVIDGTNTKLKYVGTDGMDIPVGSSPGDTFMVWHLTGKGAAIDVFGNPNFPVILHQKLGFEVTIQSVEPPSEEPEPVLDGPPPIEELGEPPAEEPVPEGEGD